MTSMDLVIIYLTVAFAAFSTIVSNSIDGRNSNEILSRYLPPIDQDLQKFEPKYQQILEGTSRWRKPNQIKQQEAINIKTELDNLNTTFSWQKTWPTPLKILGVVSAVSFDVVGNVVVFHRADRVWDQETFDVRNVYQLRSKGPIKENTIIAFNRNNGAVAYEFGSFRFYMPHGLTIDQQNNIWITDVALHQVMKFGSKIINNQPDLILGTEFVPGNSATKFCKPTAVAVLPNGDFFVADGYCNSRIMKFSKEGELLLQWGKNSFQGEAFDVAPENFFAIPHALALALDLGLICVADRENGRVQCFNIQNGTFHSQYHSPVIGDRLFSVAYAPIKGGQLFVVNGPTLPNSRKTDQYNEVLGFVIDMLTKKVISKFGPDNKPFHNPHDIIVSSDGTEVYVAELNPSLVYKFVTTDIIAYNQTTINVKPTATLDEPLSAIQSTITVTKVEPGATALLIVTIIVIFSIVIFGLALLISRRRKRGKITSPDLEYSKLMSKYVCED